MASLQPDYSDRLRQLMQQVELASFKALSTQAGISVSQVRQLRRGKVERMRVDSVLKLSQALRVPIAQLLTTFGAPDLSSTPPALAALQQEYDRLHAQLATQRHVLQQEFQQSALQTLESLLVQLPTAAYAAQQNPQLAAVKLLPLLRPIDQLLQQWGVEPIAPVGTELPYDPSQHQLMEGTAQPNQPVKVRYTGYRHGEKLLYRAKVSPL